MTEKTKKSAVRLVLWTLLLREAEKKEITVAWSLEDLRPGTHAPRSRHSQNLIGVYLHDQKTILLGWDHWLDPYTLAHEIAHHDLRMFKHSEAKADNVARDMIEKLLEKDFLSLIKEELEKEFPRRTPAGRRETKGTGVKEEEK